MSSPVAEARTRALTSAVFVTDERVVEDLLKEHQALAYSVAYRLLGREADARDAVQDAFLLAWRALRGDGAPLQEASRFRPWLLRIVANAATRQFRLRPSTIAVSVDSVANVLRAPRRNEPVAEAERRDTRRDLIRALLLLPRRQRGVLILREF